MTRRLPDHDAYSRLFDIAAKRGMWVELAGTPEEPFGQLQLRNRNTKLLVAKVRLTGRDALEPAAAHLLQRLGARA